MRRLKKWVDFRLKSARVTKYITRYLFGIYAKFLSSPLIPSVLRPCMLRLVGMEIGKHVWINQGVFFGSNSVNLGNFVALNYGCFVDGSANVTIKDYVRFGPFVKILTGSHTMQNSVIRRKIGEEFARPVVIEKGCWLHIGCIVYPGITIAEGCVIAAGAVLTKSTQPNGLYAGCPAVRTRELPVTDGKAAI